MKKFLMLIVVFVLSGNLWASPSNPGCRVWNLNTVSVPSGGSVYLTFGGPIGFNFPTWPGCDSGVFNPSDPGKLTAPISGMYTFGAQVEFAPASGGTALVTLHVTSSGNTPGGFPMSPRTPIATLSQSLVTTANVPTRVNLPPTLLWLNAGDFIELEVSQTSPAPLLLGNSYYSQILWLRRMAD